MSRWTLLVSLTILFAGCGGSRTTPNSEGAEQAVLPSLDAIDFELCSSDGSMLAGVAKAKQEMQIRGTCALSDATRDAQVLVLVHIVARVAVHSLQLVLRDFGGSVIDWGWTLSS
jgi:hypothetical protein